MMRYIGFDREDEAEMWARERLGIEVAPEFFRAISSVDDNDEFVCVVVLTNFSVRNVDVNVAMDKRKMMPKGTLKLFNRVFSFVFDTLRVARATALLRGKNIQAKRITETFGFRLEGTMRNVFPDDDMLVYGLLNDDYRTHAWYRG